MIRGISSALQGIQTGQARFERAAVDVAGATSADPVAMAAGATGVSDAMVQMAVARFALMASLRAAQASNAMIGETLRLGGYGA